MSNPMKTQASRERLLEVIGTLRGLMAELVESDGLCEWCWGVNMHHDYCELGKALEETECYVE